MQKGFHDKPFDPATLAKLRIFELYAQEWIPVFVSSPQPKFDSVEIFDFFSGPGKDSVGVLGSPLRLLSQLRNYHERGMAGWDKARITVHLYDQDSEKIETLKRTLAAENWSIPGVTIDCQAVAFEDALRANESVLSDRGAAKLLFMDQYGVDAVSDDVFRSLVAFQTTDFIFFLSSSTLHRFHDHPAIKQKIERPDDSYDVHRAAADYYSKLVPRGEEFFLGRFSIKKRTNIYGLIFGSRHPLGIHKFLQVAWANDQIAGEANFDIERANISPGEGILNLDVMKPDKQREFETELTAAIHAGLMQTEADVLRFCIEAGMTSRHSAPVLKELKRKGVIGLDFQVPDIKRLKSPRPIRLVR